MEFFSRIRRIVSNIPYTTSAGDIEIFAPITGEITSLEKVPDEVFSSKIVGDGVAIAPTNNKICAPIDGVIAKIFKGNHAFSIESSKGVEVFVHFGVGTVELNGQGLTRLVDEGSQVQQGDTIIELDLKHLKTQISSTLTSVLIANMEDIGNMTKNTGHVRAGKDVIFTATRL